MAKSSSDKKSLVIVESRFPIGVGVVYSTGCPDYSGDQESNHRPLLPGATISTVSEPLKLTVVS